MPKSDGYKNIEKHRLDVLDSGTAREVQSAGGKACQANRRKRKALRETMEALLELPIYNYEDYNELAQYGFDMNEADNSALVVLGLFKAAKNGDVAAQKELRSLIGEGGDTSGVNQVIILGGDQDVRE